MKVPVLVCSVTGQAGLDEATMKDLLRRQTVWPVEKYKRSDDTSLALKENLLKKSFTSSPLEDGKR